MTQTLPDSERTPSVEVVRRRADLDALLTRTANGEIDAFLALYDAVSPRLYGLVLRILRDPVQAEEVAQEVFVDIWSHPGRFDQAKGSALGWILMKARHAAINRVRSSEAARSRDHRYHHRHQHVAYDSTAEVVEDLLQARAVRASLRSLSVDQRAALELFYLEDLSQKDVALRLGVPLGTIKSRIRDGLVRLREQYPSDRR